MRGAVSAVFFLATVPLGLMAAEVQASYHRTSNAPGAVGEEAQHVSVKSIIVCARGGTGVIGSDFTFPSSLVLYFVL